MKENEGEGGRKLPRRQALLLLAGLPQVLFGLGSVGGGGGWEMGSRVQTGWLREEVLPVVAGSITASWHLLNEGEFETVEQTVSSYLPLLSYWAYHPSPVQADAATLAAQGQWLLGLVAYHRLQFRQELDYDREGLVLSRLAGEPILVVKALAYLGQDYYHLGAPLQMQQVLEEARSLLTLVPSVLHRTVYTGLALAYASQGQAREALDNLSRAREGDASVQGELPVYLQADEGPWRLILREGWVRLELNRHEGKREHALAAERALAQIESLAGRGMVPERIRLEILNRRGEAAIGRGELEEYVSYTVQGAEGARRLGSGKRRQELVSNWRRALERWPGEKRVQELSELLLWT